MASRTTAPSELSASAPKTRTRKSAPKASPKEAEATTATAPDTAASAGTPGKTSIPDDLRRQWVSEAAYFIAQRRGFGEGSTEQDWLEAEADIERMLAATRH